MVHDKCLFLFSVFTSSHVLFIPRFFGSNSYLYGKFFSFGASGVPGTPEDREGRPPRDRQRPKASCRYRRKAARQLRLRDPQDCAPLPTGACCPHSKTMPPSL